jgi:hypothetical protein
VHWPARPARRAMTLAGLALVARGSSHLVRDPAASVT